MRTSAATPAARATSAAVAARLTVASARVWASSTSVAAAFATSARAAWRFSELAATGAQPSRTAASAASRSALEAGTLLDASPSWWRSAVRSPPRAFSQAAIGAVAAFQACSARAPWGFSAKECAASSTACKDMSACS